MKERRRSRGGLFVSGGRRFGTRPVEPSGGANVFSFLGISSSVATIRRFAGGSRRTQNERFGTRRVVGLFVDELREDRLAGAKRDAASASDALLNVDDRQTRVFFFVPNEIDRFERAFAAADRAFLLIINQTAFDFELDGCNFVTFFRVERQRRYRAGRASGAASDAILFAKRFVVENEFRRRAVKRRRFNGRAVFADIVYFVRFVYFAR